uniref:Uncharacterized protein n=1 Tax=Gasterosteus aculeatus TaxID=69293 RepID=G3PK86_GASAC
MVLTHANSCPANRPLGLKEQCVGFRAWEAGVSEELGSSLLGYGGSASNPTAACSFSQLTSVLIEEDPLKSFSRTSQRLSAEHQCKHAPLHPTRWPFKSIPPSSNTLAL